MHEPVKQKRNMKTMKKCYIISMQHQNVMDNTKLNEQHYWIYKSGRKKRFLQEGDFYPIGNNQ